MTPTNWEYLLVPLALASSPDPAQAGANAVGQLNGQGSQGWEAVGLTTRQDGNCNVLMKRPLAQGRASGGRM